MLWTGGFLVVGAERVFGGSRSRIILPTAIMLWIRWCWQWLVGCLLDSYVSFSNVSSVPDEPIIMFPRGWWLCGRRQRHHAQRTRITARRRRPRPAAALLLMAVQDPAECRLRFGLWLWLVVFLWALLWLWLGHDGGCFFCYDESQIGVVVVGCCGCEWDVIPVRPTRYSFVD